MWQDAEYFYVTSGGSYIYHWALNGKFTLYDQIKRLY